MLLYYVIIIVLYKTVSDFLHCRSGFLTFVTVVRSVTHLAGRTPGTSFEILLFLQQNNPCLFR